jgi:hypothetical protein
MPPGTLHAAYKPVLSFSIGVHFYHYICLGLTDLMRYINAEVTDCTINQTLEHALEPLCHMMMMVPYVSWHTGMQFSS